MKKNTLQEFVRRSGYTLFLLVMTALLAPARMWGQETITIGEGTTSSYYYPFNMYFNYSLTQQIYTADEIGEAGTITSVSFYYDYTSPFTMDNETLYMKNVARSEFANNTDMEPLTEGDIVWTGTFSASAAGWVTITLNTPFEYDGTNNLLIAAFDGNNGFPGKSYTFRTTDCTDYRAIGWFNDNNIPDPYNTGAGYSSSKRIDTYRNNIKLSIIPITPKPQNLAYSNVTAHEATLSWTAPNENVQSYQYQYQPAGGNWTELFSTTNTSVTLTGLLSDTDYTFQVRALYSEGESSFASKSFHTEISCPVPTDLQASYAFTDLTTANVSWTENGTASNWVLEYGTAADFTGATSVNVSGTPSKVLTGLTAETKYYLRVKADCGGGDQSQWSEMYEFTPSLYITIGDEATTYSSDILPVATDFTFSLVQQIYTAAEVAAAGGSAGTITSIAFYYKGNTTATSMNSIQVYMKNTSKSNFESNSDFIAIGPDDMVFEGSLPLPVESGWVTLALDNEFNYDGTSNIMVCLYDLSDDFPGSSYKFYYTSTSYYPALAYFDYNNCPNLNNLSSFNAARYDYHSNIRFQPTITPRPQNLTANDITAYSTTLTWTAANTNVMGYQYQYKQGEGQWTDLVSTTGTSVDLTLEPEAEYTFRVKALYGENESGFSTLSFTALATCPKPTNLQCTLNMDDGTIATLTWLQGYEEEDWILQYGTDSEFAAGSYTEVTENFIVDGTTITANLTGLTPGTRYYAHVKANCAPDDQSYWSNVVEFRPTLHITVYDGIGWADEVPIYASRFGYATKSECIMPADSLIYMDECQITSLTFYLFSVEKDTWGNASQQVFLREVDAPFFDYINNWSDTTQVFVGNLPSPSPSDETYTITFNRPYTYHGGHLLIGVYNIQTGSSNNVYWYGIQSNALQGASEYGYAGYIGWVNTDPTNFLPKTTFGYIPNPTARPRNLKATNIAIHSASLSWTAANENVTGYQYRYKPEGGEWTEWTGTTALSVDLEGLAAETEYTFQVKALYGEVESNIASTTFTPTPNMFLTLYKGATDADFTVPIYSSKYNNYTKNESLFPATQLAGMDGASISAITFYAKEVYSGSLNGTTQVFVKEVDHASLSGYEGTEGATIVFEGQLPEPTLSLDGYTINFSQEYTYHGGNLLIGIYNITPGSSSKQVYWYGLFASNTNNLTAKGYNSSSLESVSCSTSKWLPKTTFTYFFRNPWNLQVSDITLDGATLSWNEPRVDYLRCEYQYQAEGSEEWSDLVSTNETAVALTGLTSETNYVFRVRAVYEGEVAGDFVSVTFQLPVTIDVAHSFADGFEEGNKWILINGTETNQWMIGTATANNSTKSLYISNDGQNNAYSNNSSHVFATKTFHLPAGTYEVGYDWKNLGCSQDKVRVVLAPESATFVGGQTAVEYIQSSECIPLDNGGTLYNSTYWNNYNTLFEIEEEGEYKMVFYWCNFNGSAYTPPAAIDNFYINRYLGDAPDDLTVTNITAHTADLSWHENGTAEAWQVKYYTEAEFEASDYNVEDENYGHIVEAATNTNFTLSGLDPETDYIFFVRSCYTEDGMTGYTHWSNSEEFETAVSCFPVTNLHMAELGTTSAMLAWSTDIHQEAGNAPTSWNVRYATAPAVTYHFETEEGTPDYSTDEETDWSVEVGAENAHAGSHYLMSHNGDYETSIFIPACGGGAASFWAKSLVEDENDTVYIEIRYSGSYNSGGGGGYKNSYYEWISSSLVTSDDYQKIAVDLADYMGNGTLKLVVSGMVAIDDITVNVLNTTVTQQTLDFNQGSIGDYAVEWNACSIVFDGENGYIMTEAGAEIAGVIFPLQLGGQVTFLAKALDVTEAIEYTIYVYQFNVFNNQMEVVTQKTISVTDTFANYTWDLSTYSGEAYLMIMAEEQPSLVIDDLSIPLVSMYTALTVDEPTLQMANLEQLAVYEVYVQAHCGEEDESYWEETSFVPALCESENQCMISYEWNTTEGNGPYADAYLKVVHHDSGLRVGFVEMDLGTSGAGTLSLCDGETYDLYYYYSGKNYVDFTVYDPAGDTIANYAQFQSLMEDDDPHISFTMDCSVCQWPLHLTATNITTESALLTWENGGPNYNVRYRSDHGTLIFNEGFENLETGLPTGWYGASYDEDNDLFELSSEVWDLYYDPEDGAITGFKMLEANTDGLLLIPVTNAGEVSLNAYGGAGGPKKQNRDAHLSIAVYNGDITEPFTVPEDNIKWSENISGLGNYSVDLEGYSGYLLIAATEGVYIDDVKVFGPASWTTINNVDNTQLQLTSLELGTTYEVQVQSVCGNDEFSNWATSEFTTPFCNPANQCPIVFSLYDSFGDGWNGAYIAIVSGSTEVARLTMENGSSLVGELPLCPESYQFVWHSGEYDNECSFEIIGSDEESIISISNPSAGPLLNDPYEHFCRLEVSFTEGWNWWAPTAAGTVEDVHLGLGTYYVDIIAENDELEPTDNLVAGQMYKVLVSDDCFLSLDGEPFTAASVILTPGAHWFGFIGNFQTDIEDVFEDFDPVEGDKVISQNEGFAIFNGTEWVGTLTNLVPGKGYVYVSQATGSKTLILGQ